MQFSGPPRNISNHVQHRFTKANDGSANTTRVHALFLSSKQCKEYHIYFVVEYNRHYVYQFISMRKKLLSVNISIKVKSYHLATEENIYYTDME